MSMLKRLKVNYKRKSNLEGYVVEYKLNTSKIAFIRELCNACGYYNFTLRNIAIGGGPEDFLCIKIVESLEEFEKFYGNKRKGAVRILLQDNRPTDYPKFTSIMVSAGKVKIQAPDMSVVEGVEEIVGYFYE